MPSLAWWWISSVSWQITSPPPTHDGKSLRELSWQQVCWGGFMLNAHFAPYAPTRLSNSSPSRFTYLLTTLLLEGWMKFWQTTFGVQVFSGITALQSNPTQLKSIVTTSLNTSWIKWGVRLMNKNGCLFSAIHQCEKDISNSVLWGISKDRVTQRQQWWIWERVCFAFLIWDEVTAKRQKKLKAAGQQTAGQSWKPYFHFLHHEVDSCANNLVYLLCGLIKINLLACGHWLSGQRVQKCM